MNKWYIKLIVFILFLAIVIFLIRRSKNLALKDDFNGLVQKVSIYGGKGDVKVEFKNGESHILSLYSVKKEDNIQIGDSLYKRKGEADLYHFKKDSTGAFQFYKMYSYTTFFD